MSRLQVGGLLVHIILLIPAAFAVAEDPSDERVRLLVASLDKRIQPIEEGTIALPALLASLSTQASLPGADKDPRKRVSIVVSCDDPETGAPADQKSISIHFSAKLVGARLDSVLDRVCSRFDGVMLVRADYIEIVSRNSALAEFGLLTPAKEIQEKLMQQFPFINGFNPDKYQPAMPQLVNRFLTQVPLEKALRQVAERYNQNVILSPHAISKGETVITARLVNAPIDAAVETLANMADLRMVQKSNVFLVTTKEHAAVLNADRKQQLKAEKARAEKENWRD